jgi:pimeloyl-ACP methyl ester carboxylesterase
MIPILIGTGVLTGASLLLCGLVWLGILAVRRRRPSRFWRRALWAHVGLVPAFALLGVPAGLGFFATRLVHTRLDEAGYRGPRFDDQGNWLLQSRASLREFPETGHARHAVTFASGDGLPLRAFLVAPQGGARRPPVVLVHGLFRGALELEPVAAHFRELGAEVLLLELRNHGDSGRAPATFGVDESQDVLAAVRFLRARPGHERDRVILFGVSLGGVAVALAAPQVENLAALVLDAPLDDLRSTGERMLNLAPQPGRRRIAIPQPFRWLTLQSVALWSGVALAEIQPVRALRTLPADLPSLIVGGGDDLRAPPDVVRGVYAALAAPEGVKELWIREGSDHGSVWTDDPAGYRARLERLVGRIR